MSIGDSQARMERMLLIDREIHLAWADAHAWKYPTLSRGNWREGVAALLVALATRIAPTVAAPEPSTAALPQ